MEFNDPLRAFHLSLLEAGCGSEMISRVCRHQRQRWTFLPLGHQGYRLRSYNKDPPLHSGYTRAVGGTLRPLGKTLFLHCQRRHPELPTISTYRPLSLGAVGGRGGQAGGGAPRQHFPRRPHPHPEGPRLLQPRSCRAPNTVEDSAPGHRPAPPTPLHVKQHPPGQGMGHRRPTSPGTSPPPQLLERSGEGQKSCQGGGEKHREVVGGGRHAREEGHRQQHTAGTDTTTNTHTRRGPQPHRPTGPPAEERRPPPSCMGPQHTKAKAQREGNPQPPGAHTRHTGLAGRPMPKGNPARRTTPSEQPHLHPQPHEKQSSCGHPAGIRQRYAPICLHKVPLPTKPAG